MGGRASRLGARWAQPDDGRQNDVVVGPLGKSVLAAIEVRGDERGSAVGQAADDAGEHRIVEGLESSGVELLVDLLGNGVPLLSSGFFALLCAPQILADEQAKYHKQRVEQRTGDSDAPNSTDKPQFASKITPRIPTSADLGADVYTYGEKDRARTGVSPVCARNYPESPYFVPWITLSKSS